MAMGSAGIQTAALTAFGGYTVPPPTGIVNATESI
jgi:hypothetical protein